MTTNPLLTIHYEQPKPPPIESIVVTRRGNLSIKVSKCYTDIVWFSKEGSTADCYTLSLAEVDAFCEALQQMKQEVKDNG